MNSLNLFYLLSLWFMTYFCKLCLCGEKKILFNKNIDGLIAAFNDFDSDRFTDVFIITNNGNTLQLLKSIEDEPDLELYDEIKCSFDEKITGIIPADFTGDAIMDIMVITQPKLSKQLFKIWIIRGNKTHIECDTKKSLIDNALGHPLILDYNGDMITDFLIETLDCPYELWIMNSKHFHGDCRRDQFGDSSLRLPHSNAFVNIRNCQPDSLDYTTDIVITNKNQIEYWLNRDGFNIENRINIRYPDESTFTIGQSAYIDLNIDGCIEHIIAACKNVGFMFRTQCLPQILWYDNKQNEWINIADFSNHTNLYFEKINTQFNVELPIAVRFGDIDSDGYVDLITVMKNKTESGQIKQIAVVLRNIHDDEHPNRRKFVIFWTSEQLIHDDDVELASFLDIQENGKLDIILTTKNSSNHYNVQWILNTFVDNSCFLKILVTSGLCSETCPNEKVPYGTNQPGPFVCYETSNLNGQLIKGCSAQLSQSSYFSLQMPYSIFGLGETPNFVETVYASIPSGINQQVRKSKWTQIVPDAQVVLIPYPPNETKYWIGKLFYTPSNMISSTLATLAIICVILIIIIFILHRKEVMEDLTEHEEYKRHWPESR